LFEEKGFIHLIHSGVGYRNLASPFLRLLHWPVLQRLLAGTIQWTCG